MLEKGKRIKFSFSFKINLGQGNYSITVAFHNGRSHVDGNYEWVDLAAVFQVINMNELPFAGITYLPTDIRIEDCD